MKVRYVSPRDLFAYHRQLAPVHHQKPSVKQLHQVQRSSKNPKVKDIVWQRGLSNAKAFKKIKNSYKSAM
jgi:hypothetical protein